jgi:hypothetical protein
MALSADSGGMNASQWKARRGMIEVRIQPVVGVVAHRAINRINLGFMIFCAVILNLMTGDTFRWGVQYSSFVAGRALGNSRMSTGQLKSSGGVVKGRWLPSGRSMASLALNR